MSIKVKVRGGTTKGDEPSLCVTCKWATIVRGDSLKEEIVECASLSGSRRHIKFRVTSCSAYQDRMAPSLRDMEDMAWILRTDKKNRIGFVPAKDIKPQDRYVLYGDDD